ncbi:formate dehydrogenase subunit gamma [Pelomicrobium methylotrophicum]|uniref:Formate dehydrogenase subunit gamma n=1 Tax=Pelomicrobium methylotrophicum TaxID=2602750 RepID=A0A5C7EYW7_9PROT|nr:formate dehydrogenase subunit gamma [Pelomicrobium methylotrophicum]TXF12469.1 formate dehydrogenase subunit gamma [Pelomicrobium methylotrophicum]
MRNPLRGRFAAMAQAVAGAVLIAAAGAALAAPGQQPFVTIPQEEVAQQQQQRQETQPLNNAPVWREVRSGQGITQIRGVETGVLVQSQGETWREMRNGPVTFYGGILMVAVPVLILVFYLVRGPLKQHEPDTGRKILRFSAWDRVIHWSTAISWLILAITGLIILFGKYVLLPVFGYTVFAFLANLSKNLHNFVGPYFIVSALAMVVTYAGRNLPRAYDLQWLAKLGGFFSNKEVPSGFFNAGEKLWFWIGVFLLTIVVSVTGLILDFPNFGQGREAMQLANVIHAIGALLYMAFGLGHIYLGTIGVQGAYHSMRYDGMVDEAWAKAHHEYWYEEVKAQQKGSVQAAGAVGGGEPQRA